MINSISSRGTLYDITGYLVPGFAVEGLTLLIIYAFGGESIIRDFIKEVWNNGGFLSTTLFVVAAYVLGHMINSISSAILEKRILQKKFKEAMNWLDRVNEDGGARAARIESRARELFKIEAKDLKVFDLLARAAEYLPSAFMSGFSFLSFYGMCRSLSLICFLAIPFVFLISFKECTCICEHKIVCKIVVGVLSSIPVLIAAIAFGNQYLRFVKYYADYLASTLLCRGENESVVTEKAD